MKVAWLFPGQAMEVPRMGLALAAQHDGARRLLARAGACIGQDPWDLLERGGPPLERTEILQPLITAVSLGVASVLSERLPPPDYVAGHSLGEVAAWAASGGISFEAAIALAHTRGAAMGEEAERHPGGMIALLHDEAMTLEALRAGQHEGVVDLAAHNAPREWVLSGERRALEAIARAFPVRPLAASGPWHGRLMAGAVTALGQAVDALSPGPLRSRFIVNHTGEPTSDDQVPRCLVAQLQTPVQWARTLDTLAALGVTRFVTVGPGRVLRGLVRKNLGPEPAVHTTEDPVDIARTCEKLLETTRGP